MIETLKIPFPSLPRQPALTRWRSQGWPLRCWTCPWPTPSCHLCEAHENSILDSHSQPFVLLFFSRLQRLDFRFNLNYPKIWAMTPGTDHLSKIEIIVPFQQHLISRIIQSGIFTRRSTSPIILWLFYLKVNEEFMSQNKKIKKFCYM